MNVKRQIEGRTVEQKGTILDVLGNLGAIKIPKDAKISFTVGKYALERKSRVWIDAYIFFQVFRKKTQVFRYLAG